ncbi:MAG: sigma-70 family RNA polymerase sigma factor [Candidatus Poribacteria bacterium]|nr:sigma-70 family RNA polymerase sigma factor [Candidatus Poribacteria bacterium]
MDKLIDDEMLVAQFKSGSQKAFDELMKRYERRIFGYLLRSVRNYEDAEDLTLEVFFKAYRALDSWEPKAKFSTWLYTIASNLAIDYHRSKARQPVYVFEDEDVIEARLVATDISSNPEKQLEEKERGRIIREAVDELSSKQKAVFMLTRYEGLQIREVAEALGMAEGTVKIHLHRAMKKLQTLLRPLWENNEL